MVNRTYTLPERIVARFETFVSEEDRSVIVAQVLESWLEEQRRTRSRAHTEEDVEEWPDPPIVWPNGLKAEREKHGDNLDLPPLS